MPLGPPQLRRRALPPRTKRWLAAAGAYTLIALLGGTPFGRAPFDAAQPGGSPLASLGAARPLDPSTAPPPLAVADLPTAAGLLDAIALLDDVAEAACGASASSCKSCHETRAVYPVSQLGDWHVQHSFGDFCEFCHGGTITEQTAAAAHQGLREPFADPDLSCGACHQGEVAARAQKYGVVLASAGGGQGGSSDGPSPEPKAAVSSQPAPPLRAASTLAGTATATAAAAAPSRAARAKAAAASATSASAASCPDSLATAFLASDIDLVDFNRILEGEPRPRNVGNQVLALLNLVMAAGLVVVVWRFESRPDGWLARIKSARRKE